MKVVVDEDRCIGAGQCARWAPEHFEQDEETGLVRAVGGPVVEGTADVRGAVKACPSGALREQF